MGMGLHLHRNRIPSGVGGKEVPEGKGSRNPVFVSPSSAGIMQISCWGQSYWEVPARFKGFLDRPRLSGGGGASNQGSTVHSEEGTS